MAGKILITGGAGYIGSITVHYLIEKGILPNEIIVFDNLAYGHQEFLPSQVQFIKGDLLNKEDIAEVFMSNNIDKVIHFAAYAYVGESMNKPGKYFENNILGGLNLLDSMQKNDCMEIIFSSTCAIYGLPPTIPIKEDAKQKPINPYGESKLMFEKVLEWYHHVFGIKSVRLRYFNAAGACFGIGEKHDPETHLIPLVLLTASGDRENVSIFGTDYKTKDGTCIRDYIHVRDLADAHYKALQLLKKVDYRTDYFNLGTGQGVSVKEIINLAESITGREIKTKVEKRRNGDPALLIADYAKANKYLGWTAQYNIREIIKDAWNWHKNKGALNIGEADSKRDRCNQE